MITLRYTKSVGYLEMVNIQLTQPSVSVIQNNHRKWYSVVFTDKKIKFECSHNIVISDLVFTDIIESFFI